MFHEIKNLYLRWSRGVGCCDLASYYSYFAPKIARDLRVFKKEKSGYPADISEKEWDVELDEMIFAFDFVTNGLEMTENAQHQRMQKGLELFGKRFRNLWI